MIVQDSIAHKEEEETTDTLLNKILWLNVVKLFVVILGQVRMELD